MPGPLGLDRDMVEVGSMIFARVYLVLTTSWPQYVSNALSVATGIVSRETYICERLLGISRELLRS